MYIVADSDFVEDANAECDFCEMENGNKAAAAIQEIFAGVKDVYLRDACVDLTLLDYEIRTDPNNDPYRDMRLESDQVCGSSSGLLEKFTSYVRNDATDPSGGDRTTIHLFYGLPNASGSRTIGCAYIGAICGSFGVGVNEMSFRGVYSSNLVLKRNLLAHENGHNHDGQHDRDIMAPSINTAAGFSEFSVNQIQDCVNGDTCNNSCIEFEDRTHTVSPTAAPTINIETEAPSTSPTRATPVPLPDPTTLSPTTTGPTPSPSTDSPTSLPSAHPTVQSTVAPTPAPGLQCTPIQASCDNTPENTPACCDTDARCCTLFCLFSSTEVCTGVSA